MNTKFSIIEQDGVERIDFWDEHWYKFSEDKIYPSVSKVISDVMSKGFGFDQWLRDTGNESKYIVRQAAESGSRIHNAIENLLLENPVSAKDGEYTKDEWSKIYSWFKWWKERGIEVDEQNGKKMIEAITVSHNFQVAGTVDLVGIIDGEKWVIDWKTGNSIHDTNELQVAAYAGMLGINKAMIVHIGAQNKERIKEYEIDVPKLSEHFKRVVELFKWRNPNLKPPITEYPLTLLL